MGVKVDAVQALAAAVSDLPTVEVRSAHERDDHTRVVLSTKDFDYTLDILWVGQGWPNEVRKTLARLDRPPPPTTILAAKRFAPGAAELLQDSGANWVDQSGQAWISVPPGLLITREGRPGEVEHPAAPELRWSRSALEIAERVLHEGMREVQTGRLANQSGWSAPQVSKVLKMFDAMGWTEQLGGKSGRATRRRVIAPGSLLDSWSSEAGHQRRRALRAHVVSSDLLRFAHMELWDRLGRDGEQWALTTWAGLQMTTPFVTTVPSLHIYVAPDPFDTTLKSIARAAGLREVTEGARVEFWEASFSILTQRGEPTGIPVISRPRLFADLMALGGRATDAANHYREVALGI